jgi:hypothetical protein
MRNVARLLLILALAGCKKEAAPEAAADSSEAPITAAIPDSADAKTFARALVHTQVTGFHAVSSVGAGLVYDALTFAPDGTWSAKATVKAADETFECAESGQWTIDEVSSASVATMNWILDTSNCATREPGATQRVQVTLGKDQPVIEFR